MLRLDRAAQRKVVDDLLDLPRRVLVVLVHGEEDQGHDHFAEVLTARLRMAEKSPWDQLVVVWPPPSPSLGIRLALLFEELAHALRVTLTPPAADPSTPEGARAWAPTLAPILDAIDARRQRLFVLHVLHGSRTGAGADEALVAAYGRAIWARMAARPGAQVVVGLDLRRSERAGLPMSRGWRTARAELAAGRAIATALDRIDMPCGGLCLTLPELTSVAASDLSDWLRLHGGRRRDAAELEAIQLVMSTRGGRFDLVAGRLRSLHVNRLRKAQ